MEANRSIAMQLLEHRSLLSMSFAKPNRRKRDGIKPYQLLRPKYEPPAFDPDYFAAILEGMKHLDADGYRMRAVPPNELDCRVRRVIPKCRPMINLSRSYVVSRPKDRLGQQSGGGSHSDDEDYARSTDELSWVLEFGARLFGR